MNAWLQFAGAVITAVLALAGMYVVKRIDSRTTRETTAVDGYKDLVADLREKVRLDREDADRRISALEASDAAKGVRLDSLRTDLDEVVEDRHQLVDYLRHLWRWVVAGSMPPPPPVPDHLRDILPEDEWTWPERPERPDPPTD